MECKLDCAQNKLLELQARVPRIDTKTPERDVGANHPNEV